MISINELNKDDLRVLMEGFNTEFLLGPLLHSSKGLNHYIPKGFRIHKLSRNQIIKVYIDAITGNEPSITNFIEKTIKDTFEQDDIHCPLKEGTDATGVAEAVIDLTIDLLQNGFTIPAYIVLLLDGVECSSELKQMSIRLFQFYNETMDTIKGESFEKGFEKGLNQRLGELNNEKKANAKAKKACEDVQKKKAQLEAVCRTQEDRIEELEAEENAKEQTIAQLNIDCDRLQTKVRMLENKLLITEKIQEEKDKLERQIKELQKLIEEKDESIHSFNVDIENAKAMAFSDRVLHALCTDVIDEMQASTLSRKEILQIAKAKFSSQARVSDAWKQMSNDSDNEIDRLITDFSTGVFNELHIDSLEAMEDEEMIKLSVLKSLKAILYHSLEKNALETAVNVRIGGIDSSEE